MQLFSSCSPLLIFYVFSFQFYNSITCSSSQKLIYFHANNAGSFYLAPFVKPHQNLGCGLYSVVKVRAPTHLYLFSILYNRLNFVKSYCRRLPTAIIGFQTMPITFIELVRLQCVHTLKI